MNLHRTLITAALAALTIAPATSASATITKDQAFARASACLKAHGVRTIIQRGDGGGLAQLPNPRRGSAAWNYVVSGTQVVSVKVWYYASPPVLPATKLMVRRCVNAGI